MNTAPSLSPFLFALAALAQDQRPFGENTWNRVTTRSTVTQRGGDHLVRLHLGSKIDRQRHLAVLQYLQTPGEAAACKAMRDVIVSIPVIDHSSALEKLGAAIMAQRADHWTFIPFADVNQNGALYRIDLHTEAKIYASDLVAVQTYVETGSGPGKAVLHRVFITQRADEAAADILDLVP